MAKRSGSPKKTMEENNKIRLRLVVQTGFFQVKIGISISNDLNELDRRPSVSWHKNSEIFPVVFPQKKHRVTLDIQCHRMQ